MLRWTVLLSVAALVVLSPRAYAEMTWAQMMAVTAAENAWKSLPPPERACIEEHLRQAHASSVGVAIRNGILPSDPRFGSLVSKCAAAYVQATWQNISPQARACMNRYLAQSGITTENLEKRGVVFSENQYDPRPQQQQVARLYGLCRAQVEKQGLLDTPTITLSPNDQDTYYSKLMKFIGSNKAITAAVRENNMAAAAQTCTELLGSSANCDGIFRSNNSNCASVSCALTSLQFDALSREENAYVVNNLFLADNTQFDGWHCNIMDVFPAQMQGGGGVITPQGTIIQNGPRIGLPGRVGVTFHNGGQILCVFDFPNLPIISGFSPPDYKIRITLNVEDENQLGALSKNEEIKFDARAFCSQAEADAVLRPDPRLGVPIVGGSPQPSNHKCIWSNLTFIAQRVSNKPN